MDLFNVVLMPFLLAPRQTAAHPQIHYGLWEFVTNENGNGASKGSSWHTGSTKLTVCITANNYLRVLDVDQKPADGCTVSHSKWKGTRYSADLSCQEGVAPAMNFVLWVTVPDAEHVSIRKEGNDANDVARESDWKDGHFVSATCPANATR